MGQRSATAALLFALATPGLASANAIFGIDLNSGGWDAFALFDEVNSGDAFQFGFETTSDGTGGVVSGIPNGWTADYALAILGTKTLLSRTTSSDGVTQYQFGSGRLQIDFELSKPGSTSTSGSYVAEVPAFTVVIREDEGEGSDCPCLEVIEFSALDGKLDQSLARAFGVSRHASDGYFWGLAEHVVPAFGDGERHGVGFGYAGFTAVPEPSAIALLAVAALGGLARRMRRSRPRQP